MRYELFGVARDGAFMEYVGAFPSYTKAIDAVPRELNELTYPDFLILEKVRKNQAPIGCSFGQTKARMAHRSTSFVLGFNPTESAIDFQAYRDRWHMQACESHAAYENRKADLANAANATV